jgi:hypothetical protein
MNIFPTVFDTSSRIRRPIADRAIFWPTVLGVNDDYLNADSTKFPAIGPIKIRYAAYPPEPLSVFVKAVRDAEDRILIVDDYLLNPSENTRQNRVDQILGWFPDSFRANAVRLLTGSIGDPFGEDDILCQFKEREQQINKGRSFPPFVTIEVRFTLGTAFPYIHDRFAIIDDELWHFGATVGGFHNKVNAATRGWVAEDHDAVVFFDTAWKGDSDVGKYGRSSSLKNSISIKGQQKQPRKRAKGRP